MWIPRWLGECYSKLYARFGGKFGFREAEELLGDASAKIALSHLCRRGFIDVLARRGRKRIYHVADPTEVTLMIGKGIDLARVPAPARATLRGFLKGLLERYGDRVISIVLYGSFARGEYGPESDIDLLLVIDGYDRNEQMNFGGEGEICLKQWELGRIYHHVQPYPLNPEQARYHRPLYLDMTVESIILYDRGDFMKRVFDEIRQRLAELGSKRCRLSGGSWYWDLKPDLKPGEVVEL